MSGVTTFFGIVRLSRNFVKHKIINSTEIKDVSFLTVTGNTVKTRVNSIQNAEEEHCTMAVTKQLP